jgi:hypothetical protein
LFCPTSKRPDDFFEKSKSLVEPDDFSEGLGFDNYYFGHGGVEGCLLNNEG